MLQVLDNISLKSCCKKRHGLYKNIKRWTQKMSKVKKKKKGEKKRDENKNNPCSRKNIPQERNIFQRA